VGTASAEEEKRRGDEEKAGDFHMTS
jgi:hypothetical protein